jgi:hypothetical protein
LVLVEASKADPITRSERTYCDARIKRLEGGTFEIPRVPAGEGAPPSGVEMRAGDLALILEGIDLASVRRRRRWRRE